MKSKCKKEDEMIKKRKYREGKGGEKETENPLSLFFTMGIWEI